jgi:hypothetical protein
MAQPNQAPLATLTPQQLSTLGAQREIAACTLWSNNPQHPHDHILNKQIETTNYLLNLEIRKANRAIGKGGPSGLSNCRLIPIRRRDGATPPQIINFTRQAHLFRFSPVEIAQYVHFYDLRSNPWLKWQGGNNTSLDIQRAKILVFVGARKYVSSKSLLFQRGQPF